MNSRVAALFVLLATSATNAQPAPQKPAAPPSPNFYATPIGAPIGVDAAKRVAAAAAAEARRNAWFMAIAVVDPAGTLVYYEKADNTQNGSATISIEKARSAALFKRPTKAFQDAVAAGGAGLRVLRLDGAVPLDGGLPIVVDGKLIGAVGVSGDLAEHDGQCAAAGVAAAAGPAPASK